MVKNLFQPVGHDLSETKNRECFLKGKGLYTRKKFITFPFLMRCYWNWITFISNNLLARIYRKKCFIVKKYGTVTFLLRAGISTLLLQFLIAFIFIE